MASPVQEKEFQREPLKCWHCIGKHVNIQRSIMEKFIFGLQARFLTAREKMNHLRLTSINFLLKHIKHRAKSLSNADFEAFKNLKEVLVGSVYICHLNQTFEKP